MFERYTEKARRVIFFARYEASQFGSRAIETEHLLLGLLRESPNLLSQSLDTIRTRIGEEAPIRERTPINTDLPGSSPELLGFVTAYPRPSGSVPAYRVIGAPVPNAEFDQAIFDAIDEARLFLRTSAGPEHLLLGLLRNERSLAATILHEHGLDLNGVRERLKNTAHGSPGVE